MGSTTECNSIDQSCTELKVGWGCTDDWDSAYLKAHVADRIQVSWWSAILPASIHVPLTYRDEYRFSSFSVFHLTIIIESQVHCIGRRRQVLLKSQKNKKTGWIERLTGENERPNRLHSISRTRHHGYYLKLEKEFNQSLTTFTDWDNIHFSYFSFFRNVRVVRDPFSSWFQLVWLEKKMIAAVGIMAELQMVYRSSMNLFFFLSPLHPVYYRVCDFRYWVLPRSF